MIELNLFIRAHVQLCFCFCQDFVFSLFIYYLFFFQIYFLFSSLIHFEIMAEKFPSDYDATSPFVPRGRGVLLSGLNNGGMTRNESFCEGIGNLQCMSDCERGIGRGRTTTNPTVRPFLGDGPFVSTPRADNTDHALQELTDMMGRLGTQIGDSIMARLAETGVINANCNSENIRHLGSDSIRQDRPQVTVHVKADREPVMFKGDGSDKYSVCDWIELTKSQLNKQKCPVSDQADEILSRLMGKARDIVKIGLRSDVSLDVVCNPEIIYSILLKYFSDASSCLPLADFYSTCPDPKEHPVDYWIRLNKAADLAEEGLRRQGRVMDNFSVEVARMFVKHCPDPELSCLFKCKPIDEWNARDIQRRLDDYQREKRAPLRHASAYFRSFPAVVQCDDPPQPFEHCQSNVQTSCPNVPQCTDTVASMAQNVRKPDGEIFSRMMSMLEQVLEKVEQNNNAHTSHSADFRQGDGVRICDVCKARSHSTKTHCLRERLCFSCFSSGHTHSACPRRVSAQRGQTGGN